MSCDTYYSQVRFSTSHILSDSLPFDLDTSTPTPLVWAILSHNRKEVKRLLDSGANPNQLSVFETPGAVKDFPISTPLSWAASDIKESDTQVLKLLIDYGANPNLAPPAQSFMFSPLNSAIEEGHTTCVEFLLRHAANPNTFDGLGKRTSLFIAIFERGSPRRELGRMLDMANFGDSTLAYHLRVYDTIIAALLKYGASPTLADPNGSTPLHAAAEYCDSALAEELISMGASVTAKDNYGESPEDIARKNCPAVLAIIQRYKGSIK